MRKIFFLLISLCVFSGSFAQTVLLSEDFEGSSSNFTSSSASGNALAWSVTGSFANSGLKADSNVVQLGDTIYLTSNSFSTVNYSYVSLEFYQIAKIHLFDKAAVEISSDNGATWIPLTGNEYLGSGFFSPNIYFSSLSYQTWVPANFTAIPQNNWWKKEKFDLSAIGSSANAKIRFVLIDADNNGSRGSYGWLLDDIQVVGAPCELIPPSISITGQSLNGNIFSKGPYNISADIQDASGIATVQLKYSVDGGPMSSVNMNNTSGSIYEALIPMMQVGDTICYSIVATDNSSCANVANEPSTGCTAFYVVNGTPPFCSGNMESSFPYTEDFDSFTAGTGSIYNPGTFKNNWIVSSIPSYIWFVKNGSTSSFNTGPDYDHTSGSGNYVYIEASGYFNETAILESPCFDLSGGGTKKMGFWYHMYGADMGELHVDIETPIGTVQDIISPIVGNQGNIWKYVEVDLSSFAGNILKFKFRGITGNNYESDIAIDDFTVFEVPADVGMQSLISPAAFGCSRSAAEYITVEIMNTGTIDIDTIPVAYKINTMAVVRDTAFINIPANASALFTFQQTANLLGLNSFTFSTWTELPDDAHNSNDSLNNILLSSATLLSSYPDTQKFTSFTVGSPGVFMDGWANDNSDANDWYVNSGSTPTTATGPSGDTSTAAGNGKYLYVDAAASSGQFASLISPCIDFSNMLKPKMKFFYHMSGADMGNLHVDVLMNGIRFNDIIPPISGDNGNKWNEKLVDLSQFSVTAKVIFRAEEGSGIHADIAVDNIIFFDDPVGLDEDGKQSEHKFYFYPNPVKSNLWIDISDEMRGGMLKIKDVSGKILLEKRIDSRQANIDIRQLEAGIYLLSYTYSNSIFVEKLIVY